jgi:hypothetical protein
MADRWTPETENLVAMELEDVLPQEVGALPDEAFYVDARRILAALADAGLLLPPGGETRTRWASHGGALVWGTEAEARREVAEGKGPLMRRAEHTGPWEVVDDHS